WEQTVCRRMTAILACSDFDRRLLCELAPTVPIFSVPNVVDTDLYVPDGTPEPFTVLFQGGLDWYPNRDAVEYFVAAVLPKLRRQIPQVVFRVAGRTAPTGFLQQIAAISGVEFTGTVPDMRAEIARAAVCVVPLRIGSGTRLKILEAAAMGKPIVSTSLGAEGLDFASGREIVVADEPHAIATSIATLINDSHQRTVIGHAARRKTVDAYGLAAFKASLDTALTSLQL
ncbi:MAG: glycosyltransferase family 4 protein, partial [Acidimicrobiia bacterium]